MKPEQNTEAADTAQTTNVPAVDLPRLVRPAWMRGSEENDWTEDSDHENGNYFGKCSTCGCDFIGHKRRFICKKCKAEDDARWAAMTEEERQSELCKMATALENFHGTNVKLTQDAQP